MTKYLSSDPFSSKPITKEYESGWEATFRSSGDVLEKVKEIYKELKKLEYIADNWMSSIQYNVSDNEKGPGLKAALELIVARFPEFKRELNA
jgi:hypothetical protein